MRNYEVNMATGKENLRIMIITRQGRDTALKPNKSFQKKENHSLKGASAKNERAKHKRF